MKREDFIKHIEKEGFKLPNRANAADRWIKEINNGTYGWKISRVAARLEVKVVHAATSYSSKKTEWVRIKSGYLSQLYFNSEGNILGFKN